LSQDQPQAKAKPEEQKKWRFQNETWYDYAL
jgi:hypothetical protein